MSDDLKTYPELQNLELMKLRKQILDLEVENRKYKEILKENDLLDEIEDTTVNVVEVMCLSELNKLKELSDKGGLTLEDTKILDLLHKNLMLARGEVKPEKSKGKKKNEQTTVAELLSIVTGDKK